MSLENDFLEKVNKLYSPLMGTEAMAPLLYSLIRFTRPQRLLEIGAGYTTPFLLKAIADNHQDYQNEMAPRGDQNKLLVSEYYQHGYAPRLICLDNDSHPGSTASKVVEVAEETGLQEYLKVYYEDFNGFTKRQSAACKDFDFVWFDCGGLMEYALFLDEYWEHINPDGGLLLLHSTLTNLSINLTIKQLKLNQATKDFHNFELVSLLEPHKKYQNSVTMIRMTSKVKDHYYSVHP